MNQYTITLANGRVALYSGENAARAMAKAQNNYASGMDGYESPPVYIADRGGKAINPRKVRGYMAFQPDKIQQLLAPIVGRTIRATAVDQHGQIMLIFTDGSQFKLSPKVFDYYTFIMPVDMSSTSGSARLKRRP